MSTTTTPVSDLAALLRAETSAFRLSDDVLQAADSGVLISPLSRRPTGGWSVQWSVDDGYVDVTFSRSEPLQAVADVALALHARLTKEARS